MADGDEYLTINRSSWDARARVHAAAGYGRDVVAGGPSCLSDTVRFDRDRLGDISGLDGVHLQCHVGTDTLSLARLGARMTGVDLSGESLRYARELADAAGVGVDYVQSDVYAAPDALRGQRFDLVYTGIGALCWLPDIARWADVVARLLRPGGRLFVRDAHPVLNAVMPVVVNSVDPDWADQQPGTARAGEATLALELPYFEQPDAIVWRDETTYGGPGRVTSPESHEWNHGLGQIVTAVLDAGLQVESLTEHQSVPWNNLGDLMVEDDRTGEFRLRVRPERLPATFTLTATRPST